MKLKYVDLITNSVRQDAREVKAKLTSGMTLQANSYQVLIEFTSILCATLHVKSTCRYPSKGNNLVRLALSQPVQVISPGLHHLAAFG